MCLKNIKYEPIQHGFKVGKAIDGGFGAFLLNPASFSYDYITKPKPTQFDVWEYAKITDVGFQMGNSSYKSAFHICSSLKEAKNYLKHLKSVESEYYSNWAIYPCEYNGVIAVGEDETGIETVLAVAIKISSTPL